jgi:hypothetical protein
MLEDAGGRSTLRLRPSEVQGQGGTPARACAVRQNDESGGLKSLVTRTISIVSDSPKALQLSFPAVPAALRGSKRRPFQSGISSVTGAFMQRFGSFVRK